MCKVRVSGLLTLGQSNDTSLIYSIRKISDKKTIILNKRNDG